MILFSGKLVLATAYRGKEKPVEIFGLVTIKKGLVGSILNS